MKRKVSTHPMVGRHLRKLGKDISIARRGRRLSTQDMADRMGVSRSTLARLEAGDPGVSLNALCMALVALGLPDRLGDLVDQSKDDIGLLLAQDDLPRRVRRRSTASQDTPSKGGDVDPVEGW